MNINLLPWRTTERKLKLKKFFLELGLSLLTVFLILLVLHFSIAYIGKDQKNRNLFLKSHLERSVVLVDELNRLKKENVNLKSQVQAIYTLQSTREFLGYVLEQLTTAMPNGAYLTTLKVDKKTVSLTGLAISNHEVNQLLDNLVRSDWFDSPKLENITAVEGQSIFKRSFQIKANIKQTQVPASGGENNSPMTQEKKGNS